MKSGHAIFIGAIIITANREGERGMKGGREAWMRHKFCLLDLS